MTQFFQYSIAGGQASGIYIMIGVGLTLIYGVSRIMNFAHGQFVVLGSYLTYSVTQVMPYLVAVALATVAVGAASLIVRYVVLKRGMSNSLVTFLVSLGLGIIIQQSLVQMYGANQKLLDTGFRGHYTVGGVVISQMWLIYVAIALPVLIALGIVLQRSSFGRSMRATAENPGAAELMGVNVSAAANLAFFIGSALAGLAGALMAGLLPFTPYSGYTYLIKGIAVVLIGGLGSVYGAAIVGLVLGIAETYLTGYGFTVTGYHFGPEWQHAYFYVLLIVVLALRPQGLFRGTGELK